MPKKKPEDRIKENIRYLEGVKEEIDALPRAYRGVGTVAAAEFFVEKLRIYPVYRFYSRAQAYGMEGAGGNWTYIDKRKGTPVTMQPVAGYFSAAQFRYVMGVVAQKYDFGYPHRTGHVRDGWKIEFTGNPSRKTTATIVNADPGAKWVHGNTTQARQPAGVGWQVTRAIIDENIEGAIEAMKKAVAEERQKRGIVKKRKK